jgi:hypothetical protein
MAWAALAFGLLGTILGVLAWTGRWRWWRDLGFQFGYGPHTLAPIGLAFTLVTLGILFRWEVVALIGVVLAMLGLVYAIWHPRWMEPRWIRGDDDS